MSLVDIIHPVLEYLPAGDYLSLSHVDTYCHGVINKQYARKLKHSINMKKYNLENGFTRYDNCNGLTDQFYNMITRYHSGDSLDKMMSYHKKMVPLFPKDLLFLKEYASDYIESAHFIINVGDRLLKVMIDYTFPCTILIKEYQPTYRLIRLIWYSDIAADIFCVQKSWLIMMRNGMTERYRMINIRGDVFETMVLYDDSDNEYFIECMHNFDFSQSEPFKIPPVANEWTIPKLNFEVSGFY